jgi:hypothetical protein
LLDIVNGRIGWPEATQHATIGRDRVIDVVPSGAYQSSGDSGRIADLLRRDAARLGRHYDTVLMVASKTTTLSGLPGSLPMHDVIYCAQLGITRHAELKNAIQSIRLAGGSPLGVVLWDDVPPMPIAPPEAPGMPPQRTAEMEALVGSRAR